MSTLVGTTYYTNEKGIFITMRTLTSLLLVILAVNFSGCVTTERVDDDGTIIRTHSIPIADARSILFFAIEAFDLVTARIAQYESQGDSLSEPDAVQLLLAQGREEFLRRGIDFLSGQFDQLEAGTKKMRVPVGLMNRVESSIESETGISTKLMSSAPRLHRPTVNWFLSSRPPQFHPVSPNDEPWRFAAAGFVAKF